MERNLPPEEPSQRRIRDAIEEAFAATGTSETSSTILAVAAFPREHRLTAQGKAFLGAASSYSARIGGGSATPCTGGAWVAAGGIFVKFGFDGSLIVVRVLPLAGTPIRLWELLEPTLLVTNHFKHSGSGLWHLRVETLWMKGRGVVLEAPSIHEKPAKLLAEIELERSNVQATVGSAAAFLESMLWSLSLRPGVAARPDVQVEVQDDRGGAEQFWAEVH